MSANIYNEEESTRKNPSLPQNFLSLRLSQHTSKPLTLLSLESPSEENTPEELRHHEERDEKDTHVTAMSSFNNVALPEPSTTTSSSPPFGRAFLRSASLLPLDDLPSTTTMTTSTTTTTTTTTEDVTTLASSSSLSIGISDSSARCPICNDLLSSDLTQQNSHIDDCLTNQLLKEENPIPYDQLKEALEKEQEQEVDQLLSVQTRNEEQSKELRGLLDEMHREIDNQAEEGLEALYHLFNSSQIGLGTRDGATIDTDTIGDEVERTMEAIEQEVDTQVLVAAQFINKKTCARCGAQFDTYSSLYIHIGMNCRDPSSIQIPRIAPPTLGDSSTSSEYVPSLREDLLLSFSINKQIRIAFQDQCRSAIAPFLSEKNVRIEKVNNSKLLSSFMLRWRYFKIRYPFDSSKHDPIIAYHGTRPHNKDGIIQRGLLIGGRGVARTTGNIYGTGIYCSVSAAIAKSYTAYTPHVVFVCAALLGKQNVGGTIRWGMYYDSNVTTSRDIIVIYTPSQILPLYCIIYD